MKGAKTPAKKPGLVVMIGMPKGGAPPMPPKAGPSAKPPMPPKGPPAKAPMPPKAGPPTPRPMPPMFGKKPATGY